MANDQEEVAILFADISNFDDIVNEEKSNIVPLVDDLFRSFDTLCDKYGA
jgi:hypothetical protein